jgi:hypothetical protein
MCKEMPVILVDRVVEKKRIIRNKWRAKEEERYKVSLPPPKKTNKVIITPQVSIIKNLHTIAYIHTTLIGHWSSIPL